jgi:Bifunctional DNA primase/polymerase, N-terminal
MIQNEKGTACGGANPELNSHLTTTSLNPQKSDVNTRLAQVMGYHKHLTRYLVPMLAGTKQPQFKVIQAQRGTNSWKTYLENPPTADEVYQWYELDPDVGVAIITGTQSALAVLDDDGFLPCDTAIPFTPGWRGINRGYLFRLREGRHAKADGFELRYGGLAILPPSIHESGEPYKWLPGRAFSEVDIAELPEGIQQLFQRRKDTSKEVIGTSNITSTNILLKEEEKGSITPGNLASSISAANCILAACGIIASSKFHSPLPGKADVNPSAVLFQVAPDTTLWLHDFGGASRCGEWVTIPEVYHLHKTSRFRRLTKAQNKVWHLRAAIECGLIEPPAVQVKELPTSATAGQRKVYAGVVLRARINELIDPGGGFAFTWQFAAEWCGVSHNTAQAAITYLLQHRFIHTDGTVARQEPIRGVEHIGGVIDRALEQVTDRVIKAVSRPP